MVMAIHLIEGPTPLRNSPVRLGLEAPRLAGAQTIRINCHEGDLELAAFMALLDAKDSIRHVRVRRQCTLNLVHWECTQRNLLLQPAGNARLN
jgi:hypothetical protein